MRTKTVFDIQDTIISSRYLKGHDNNKGLFISSFLPSKALPLQTRVPADSTKRSSDKQNQGKSVFFIDKDLLF